MVKCLIFTLFRRRQRLRTRRRPGFDKSTNFPSKTDEIKTTKETHESNHEDDQLQLSNVNLGPTYA